MKSRIVFFLVIFFNQLSISFAHNASEAFFVVQQNENGLVVKAEFPWTLRNALFQYNPALEQAKEKVDFETTFFEYMAENLILKDEYGQRLHLKEIKEMPHTGHSHQGTYELYYDGNSLSYIQNTAQFSLYPNQENYHQVIYKEKEYEFVTTVDTPSFQLTEQTSKNKFTNRILIILGVLFSLLIIFKQFRQKKT